MQWGAHLTEQELVPVFMGKVVSGRHGEGKRKQMRKGGKPIVC